MQTISLKLVLIITLIRATYSANLDWLNVKDTLIEISPRKFVNFDLPDFEKKLVCLQFKYSTTDNNEAALLKLYLVKKKTDEVSERLWSSKLLFDKQKIYEELNIDTEILKNNVADYQLQFRLHNTQQWSNRDSIGIEDVLDVKSVIINDHYCQSRYKCIKNDCLWSLWNSVEENEKKNIVKLKNTYLSNQTVITRILIKKLNLNTKENVHFVIHNKNKILINESIYSPVLKLPINLNEIQISFDCKSFNSDCSPNENIFVHYKFAEEYINYLHSAPKQLTQFTRKPANGTGNEKLGEKFVFKFSGKDLIAKQVDIVFWISIKLNTNQTLALYNIEIKNSLATNLDWKKCNFKELKNFSSGTLPCRLEQYSTHDTNTVLNWFLVNGDIDKPNSNYVELSNNKTASHLPNDLYLPRAQVEGKNQDCTFRFKFRTLSLDDSSKTNLFVYYVDDYKRSVKIWEKNEDAHNITKNDIERNWIDVSIYLGNIYQGFRLSFSVEQLTENSLIAIGGLEFENCNIVPTKINRLTRPNELDIIRISYEEPKPIEFATMTNGQTDDQYKCDFEHTTLEQCGLYQDELLEETCPDSYCQPNEWTLSLDNFDGTTNFQLPFRDRSKNFGVNGHYMYLQNMNSYDKLTRAILRFKRTISNRKTCRMKFFLRTNGELMIHYEVFADLITSGKLIEVKTSPQFSKVNFYELNQVNFENISEPFQVGI